ncbi:MAG: hypothetical protein COV10_01520 [Candidatus Vogelbacteria bacterium CG10_big_fil_rev_8_21_14_0_10_51_16]|uniref:AI-2E family transporter n=1 Tax=Candidatus Vogelbacteria bacterium CG10_big_fil_rev_8_21_14_0_10_51_16 TaxID=1975045 RepID=A0A2H0RF01_9BACT|nr:MAG: hypothetical protein COV10_01520 [Candidatus Vogelbacteria bacterium CG10_big_fil_rev_8_21_14_0_10_51_16]
MIGSSSHFTHHTQLSFFYAFVVAASVLTFFIFQPYISTLIVAASIAVAAMPLYSWLHFRLRTTSNWPAAFLATLILLLLIAGPVSFFAVTAVEEARVVYVDVRAGEDTILGPLAGGVEELFKKLNPRADFDLEALVSSGASWLFEHSATIFSGAATISFHILLALVAIFFVFLRGTAMEKSILALSPLDDSYDLEVLDKLRRAVISIVRGALLIALIQGVLAGLGFLIFGVPNPAFWGSIAVVSALLPGIGTALVLAPAILYLFLTGSVGAAVGLLVWGVIVVGLVDNIFLPRLLSHGIRLHPMILLLAVIGGINFFGLSGFILGPLTVSLLVALLDLYPLITRGKMPTHAAHT